MADAATFDWSGFERFDRQLSGLVDPDFSPLMLDWEKTIVEGNRRGVLAGLDGNDRPMPHLKYRTGAGKKRIAKWRNKGPNGFGTTLHPASAFGLGHTAADYEAATGPRLAPFGERSRIITNLFTGHGRDGAVWYAEGAWFEVVSDKGFPFLRVHFAGLGHMPRYDLRPIRPQDQALMGRQARAFMLALVRSQ